MNRQTAKEAACLRAIRLGFGLIRRNQEIHAIYANGLSEVVARSDDPNQLWQSAYEILKNKSLPSYAKEYVDPYDIPRHMREEMNPTKKAG